MGEQNLRHEQRVELILKRLTRARERAGLSQAQAARLLQIQSPSTISHYETGERELTLLNMLRLCTLYDISPAWLVTGVSPHFREAQRQEVIDAAAFKGKVAMSELHDLIEMFESLEQHEDMPNDNTE
jgi:transcriptional regulator with XRE-family HTH domain